MENRTKLYQEMGVIGTIASTPTNKFVDYPTGEIDVSRVLDGRRDCFVEPVITSAMQKKKIIVTDCLSKFGVSEFFVKKVLEQFLKDGFEVYVWTGKLERLKSNDDLKSLLSQIEIMHRDALATRLPELQLASDECYILDITRAQANYCILQGYANHEYDLIPDNMKFKKIPPDTFKSILSTFADDPVMLSLPHKMDEAMKVLYTEFIKQHKRICIDQKASKHFKGDEDCFPLLESLKLAGKAYHDDESLRAILKNAVRLKSLSIEGERAISGDFAKNLVHPQLEVLELSHGINISDEQLAEWLSHSPPLKEFKLYGCKNIKGDVFDQLPWQALQDLSISSPQFSSAHFHRLLTRASMLEKLHIEKMKEMDEFLQHAVKLDKLKSCYLSGVHLSAPILENLLAEAEKLESLYIISYSSSDGCDNFAGAEFKKKFNFPQLQTFAVEGYPGFTMQHLNQLLANAPLLKTLSLKKCGPSRDTALELSLGNLERLQISHCVFTERQVQSMLQGAQNLKSMSLTEMSMTSDNILQGCHFPELTALDLRELTGKKIKLADYLHAAPKIQSLDLINCLVDFDLPDNSEQYDIQHLEIHNIDITWMQLKQLLSRSPHLRYLRLLNCDNLSDSVSSSKLPMMPDLRAMILPGNLSHSQLYNLLDHAPHLKTLNFSPFSNDANFAEWNVPELENLYMQWVFVNGRSMEELSVRAPELQELSMIGCNFERSNIGKLTGFKKLKSLSLKGALISGQQLLSLVNGIPNLKKLDLSECRNLTTFFESVASTTLETLTLNYIIINSATLDALLQRCPNLKEMNLYHSPISDEEAGILKMKYPQMRIWHMMSNPNSDRQTYKVDSNFYSSDFKSGLSMPHVTSEIFHTENPYPHVRDYRTQVFTNAVIHAETGEVSITRPDGSHRDKVECELNRKNLAAEFSKDNQSDQSRFVGETYYAYNKSAAEPVWRVLPNLDPNDKLIAIETIPHVDIDVCFDQDESLYFFKPKQLGKNFHVTYVIEHHQGSQLVIDDSLRIDNLKIQLNKDGSLNVDRKLKALIDSMSYERKVKCLTSYFRFGNDKCVPKGKQQPESDLDTINTILEKRAGACRHRAMAFMLVAKAVNVKARIVRNECHEYVEVWMHDKWVKIDLGGWDANLFVMPVRSDYHTVLDPDNYPKLALAPVNEQDVTVIQKDNRFAVWNTYESNAETADQYADELCLQADGLPEGEKNILSVLNAGQIESVHSAFQRRAALHGNHCYYVHHLDDIRESSYLLDDRSGEFNKHDSELVSYIKQAKSGDELLVNWSDYESVHVGFNTMLDAERSLFGVPIPEGVTVIGLLDDKTTLGEDFYSRYRLISDCPAHVSDQPVMLPQQKSLINQNSNYPEIIFYDNEWKQQWYGSYQIQNQSFQFLNSAIDEAVAGKRSGVVLRNAPWHLPEFRLAVSELMTTRRLYINGKYIKIPDHFELHRDDTPLSLRIGHYQIVQTEQACQMPYVLNIATKQHFYAGFTCRKNGSLSQRAGLLEQHKGKKLAILVEDNFSHAAWAKFLAEAEKNKVKLILHCQRNVVLPAEMQKYSAITNVSPQKRIKAENKFKANVVVTNDVELEFSKSSYADRDIIRIPVNELTTYADLIERIDVRDIKGKKLFINKTSELATQISAGKKIVLTGDISALLARQLAPLFCSEPYLILNGVHTPITKGSITLVTTQKNTPICAVSKSSEYQDVYRFRALSEDGNVELLQKTCESFYARVPDYPHFTYVQLKNMLDRMRVLPTANPLTPFLRLDKNYSVLKPHAVHAWNEAISNEGWFKRRKLTKSHKKLPDDLSPVAKRLRKVMDELRSGPFVFVAGSSGIGKSRFVENDLLDEYPDFNLFSGMDHLREWLASDKSKTNILFIDEANLQVPGTFEIFAGLIQKPPVILLDGKLHEIGEHHKIIFAGNFSHYKSRHQHVFFRQHGHVITFKEFPDSFLAENIILPIMQECMPRMSKNDLEVYSNYYLRAYHHLNQKFPETHPVTARNLQMMVMRTARYLGTGMIPGNAAALAVYDECCGMLNQSGRRDFRNWLHDISHVGVDIKQQKQTLKAHVNFNAPDFHLAKNRRNPIRQLDDLFALRDMKLAKPALASAGTSGILFEGESGVGKSMMVKAYLLAHGFQSAETCDNSVSGQRKFYHLTPTDPLKMKAILAKAFHEGAVVIIDELNSLPLEHILNPLLSGVDPDGNKAKSPGFFVIGTQNPSSFVKRQVLSGALLNRVQNINLKDYGKQDMLDIATKHAPDNHELNEMVNAFSDARLFAKVNHKMMPTLRHLIAACKKV